MCPSTTSTRASSTTSSSAPRARRRGPSSSPRSSSRVCWHGAPRVLAAAGNDAGRGAELVRIHRFVAKEIGAAGSPPAEGHDGAMLIRDDALRGAAALYKAHLARSRCAIGRPASPNLLRTDPRGSRPEAELALIELASGVLSPRADVAAWLGLGANARVAFEKTGVLIIGLDGAPAPKMASAVAMLESAVLAAREASALWIGKPRPLELAARRGVLVAQSSLAATKRVDTSRLWSSSVQPEAPDGALAEIAFTLARASFAAATLNAPGVVSAADRRPRPRSPRRPRGRAPRPGRARSEAFERDAGGAALTPDAIIAHAAQLLLLDAPRATSTALVRAIAGRNEPMEQLALALGVLATGDDGKLRPTLDLGRAGDGGVVVPIALTGIKGAPDKVSEFSIDGHVIAIVRDETGAVTRVDRDGKPPVLASIPFARTPTLGGEAWTSPSRSGRRPFDVARLFGAPEVGFVDDARFLIRASANPKARDAVILKGSGPDVTIEVDLKPGERAAALLLRAAPTASGYAGVALFLEPGDGGSANLIAIDPSGARMPLVAPVPLTKIGPAGVHVKASIAGAEVLVTVGAQNIKARLPAFVDRRQGRRRLRAGRRERARGETPQGQRRAEVSFSDSRRGAPW